MMPIWPNQTQPAVSSGSDSLRSSLQQGRSRQNNVLRNIAVLLFWVALATFAVQGFQRERNIQALRESIVQVDKQFADNRLEQERLLQEREFMNSDAYIERMAREQLGMLRTNDLQFELVRGR